MWDEDRVLQVLRHLNQYHSLDHNRLHLKVIKVIRVKNKEIDMVFKRTEAIVIIIVAIMVLEIMNNIFEILAIE
jgi:hypothetical protein